MIDSIIDSRWSPYSWFVRYRRDVHIDDADLSVRCHLRLKAAGVEMLSEARRFSPSQLLAIDGFGRKCLNELKMVLADYGWHLSCDPEPPPRPETVFGDWVELGPR